MSLSPSLRLRSWALLLVPSAAVVVAGPARADDAEPDVAISPSADWARYSSDDLRVSDFERFHGIDPETLDVESVVQDGVVYGRDSNAASVMAQTGLPPLPAVQYEPTVGIVFVAMGGVTLRPNCGNGDQANSALNCSPLVDQETTFPAYGSGSQQSAMFQTLSSYYQPFNLVMTTNRPPEYLPYTLAVIGGSASQAGLGGGVCGVANVACDGLKRNHVSLTFPQSCGGVAEIAAQETAHNWGLEHTDNSNDLMYPFNNGGSKSFVDSCMAISHATGDGVTQCGHIHEEYCGNPEQQNSFMEMMQAFGPRQADTVAPEILSFSPENGATLGTEDVFTISAMVSEDSNFLGVKWTWLEGLPPEVESFDRCTNKVCDDNYGFGVDFDPNEIAWDFVTLNKAPEGTYKFQLEIMDAYGNYDTAELTINVVPGSTTTGSGDGSGSGADSAGTGSGGTDGGTSGATSGIGTTEPGGDDDGGKGCGCTTDSGRSLGSLALLGLVGLFGVGRRRF